LKRDTVAALTMELFEIEQQNAPTRFELQKLLHILQRKFQNLLESKSFKFELMKRSH
jgi:hypothetical protein